MPPDRIGKVKACTICGGRLQIIGSIADTESVQQPDVVKPGKPQPVEPRRIEPRAIKPHQDRPQAVQQPAHAPVEALTPAPVGEDPQGGDSEEDDILLSFLAAVDSPKSPPPHNARVADQVKGARPAAGSAPSGADEKRSGAINAMPARSHPGQASGPTEPVGLPQPDDDGIEPILLDDDDAMPPPIDLSEAVAGEATAPPLSPPQVRYGQTAPAYAPAPTVVVAPPPQAGRSHGGTVAVCSQCRRELCTSSMANYQGRWICPDCQPGFIQMISQRSDSRRACAEMAYAGFWIRFVASFIDGLILAAAQYAIGIAIGSGLADQSTSSMSGLRLVPLAISGAYEIILTAVGGQTLGKMVCGVSVVRADGTAIGLGRSIARYFAKFVSAFTLLIGYLIAGFDPKKRALHDMICGTRVVR